MLRMRVCGCVIALLCSCFVLLAVAQVTHPSEGEFAAHMLYFLLVISSFNSVQFNHLYDSYMIQLKSMNYALCPFSVNALRAVKSSLSDPRQHLKNWNNGDPCKSHWTGVFCFNTVGADGYLHLEELYAFFFHTALTFSIPDYVTRTVSDNVFFFLTYDLMQPTAEHESLRKFST